MLLEEDLHPEAVLAMAAAGAYPFSEIRPRLVSALYNGPETEEEAFALAVQAFYATFPVALVEAVRAAHRTRSQKRS